MAARTKDDYLELRRRYKPEIVRLAIVAESPPASGKYFYDPAGRRTEALFSALMTRLGISPGTKEEGLREFQRRGWVLVDATYEPVNKSKRRDETILRDYPHLRDDLSRLLPDRSKTPVIVIKATVCDLLAQKLKDDGFNVVNDGRRVYFPSHGRQPDFHREFAAALVGVTSATATETSLGGER
jgi:hypothetical protein